MLIKFNVNNELLMTITNLPEGVLEDISSFLPINDSIGSLSVVNKQLNRICSPKP